MDDDITHQDIFFRFTEHDNLNFLKMSFVATKCFTYKSTFCISTTKKRQADTAWSNVMRNQVAAAVVSTALLFLMLNANAPSIPL